MKRKIVIALISIAFLTITINAFISRSDNSDTIHVIPKSNKDVEKHKDKSVSNDKIKDETGKKKSVSNDNTKNKTTKEDLVSQDNTKNKTTSKKVIATIGSGKGNRESEVIIPISFNEMPKKGIISCDFKLNYDKNVLDVIKVSPGDIIVNSVANFSHSIDSTTGTISFLFVDNTYGKELITKKGVFANIKFKIKNDAVKGITPIKLKSEGAFADKLLQEHDGTFEEGNIKVY